MDAARRRRRDFLQNITIVLLSLSAVALFTQTQLYNLNPTSGSSYFRQVPQTASPSGAAAPAALTDVAAPVRVAVTGSYIYGRYGDLTLTTDNEDFSSLGTLLGEALSTARSFAACSAEDFLDSLTGISVYYDFWEPLPLSILGGLTGVAVSDGGPAVRRLVISGYGDSGVRLYLWDGGEVYAYCDVSISQERLEDFVNSYELGNASFALDNLEASPDYGAVAPCSLLLTELPEFPVLTAGEPLSDDTWLLTALDFVPHTKDRYTESSGTQVIMEGDRSLHIRPDGTIFYQSGSKPTLEISAAQEGQPTAQEAALGAGALLGTLLNGFSGDASLYLQSIRQTDGTATLQFGYQCGGLPIRFSDGGCAAEVTLTGTAVTKLSLRFRQYTVSEDSSLLLPLRQALAIAAGQPGAELTIGYADNGGETVSASWLLD